MTPERLALIREHLDRGFNGDAYADELLAEVDRLNDVLLLAGDEQSDLAAEVIRLRGQVAAVEEVIGDEMARDTNIHELIERSSLGTPEAKALRAMVSPEQVRQVVRRSHELEVRRVLGDIYTPEGVDSVMQSRNTMLNGRSPNDLLDSREWARLGEWLSRLGDGNAS